LSIKRYTTYYCFLWCALFPQKVDDFLVVALNTHTHAKTAKLTTPNLEPSPPSKNFL